MIESVETMGHDELWDYIYEDYKILKGFNQEGFYETTYPYSIRKSKPIYKKIIKTLLNLKESIRFKNEHTYTIFMSNIERFSYLAEVLSKEFNLVTISKVKVSDREYDYFKYRPIDFDEKLYRGFKEKNICYALEVIDTLSVIFTRRCVERGGAVRSALGSSVI